MAIFLPWHLDTDDRLAYFSLVNNSQHDASPAFSQRSVPCIIRFTPTRTWWTSRKPPKRSSTRKSRRSALNYTSAQISFERRMASSSCKARNRLSLKSTPTRQPCYW